MSNWKVSPSRQLGFRQLLVAARKEWLIDALKDALTSVDAERHRTQLAKYAPSSALPILGKAGVREDFVFPTPAILTENPTLIAYFRLLLGVPQKSFYSSGSPFQSLKKAETSGVLSEAQAAKLPEFCKVMSAGLHDLLSQLSPDLSLQDLQELPVLTLGSQFQGANNNTIGKKATHDVFQSIGKIVEEFVLERTDRVLKVRNASGRTVTVTLASDPDVTVKEAFGDQAHAQLAIEIKGGTDKSNAHNRAGEAEKSHQKAKNKGFRDFWTLIALTGLDIAKLQGESPTTTQWFDVAQVLARKGENWEDFKERFSGAVGIPVVGKRVATKKSRAKRNI